MADVVVINKVDTARREDVDTVRGNVALVNPRATIIEAASPITVDDPSLLKGRRAIVVEDGPTVTHGEMAYGAGALAAERYRAQIIDPRPFAVGTIRDTYAAYPHLTRVLPAMGYKGEQIRELEETLRRADADVVVIGTPVDLRHVLRLNKPAVRVTYELQELTTPTLTELIEAWLSSRSA
jgi:predicted GTPase